MPRTEEMSFLRCAAVAASPQLGVRRALLSTGRRWCLARGHHVAMFTFPSDGWRRAASGEWHNVTGHTRLDLKALARLPPKAPLKLRAWTSRGMRKTTKGTLADLLAALQAGPAHLTLRLFSSSEGVHLSWGVQEPKTVLHAPSEAPLRPSPPPGAVSWALGGELHCPRPAPGMVSKAQGRPLSCSSEALAGAGKAPGAGSTGPRPEDKPLKDLSVMDIPQEDMPLGVGEAPLSDLDIASPAASATEAQVPPGFLPGGVAPLRAEERSTGQCRPKGPRGNCNLKGPSLKVVWALVMVVLLAWHESLQGGAGAWTQAALQTLLCLLAVLPLVCWMWRRIWQESEAREGDIDFLGRRIPFLREEEMRALDGGSFLGSGGNACARLLMWGGAPVVRKEFHHDGALQFMMREARLMLELRGAGGVPRPLALGFRPLTIIQEFVGEPYDKFLMQCSVQGVLRSLRQLCRRLGEVHARGVVHNDLKIDNITVSGGVHHPVLHVIDLGWACRAGRIAGDFSLETGKEDDFPREGLGAECPWMAPEVKARRPVFASGDVFSLGILLQQIADLCMQPWLAVPLWRLGQRCAREEWSCRPCLPKVERALAALEQELLRSQLQEPFHLMVRQ